MLGKGLEQTFFSRRFKSGQRACEQTLVTGGNAKHNSEILTTKTGVFKKGQVFWVGDRK